MDGKRKNLSWMGAVSSDTRGMFGWNVDAYATNKIRSNGPECRHVLKLGSVSSATKGLSKGLFSEGTSGTARAWLP